MTTSAITEPITATVSIPSGSVRLEGELSLPENARGLVVFAHGSGSSRMSPRNQFVARSLRGAGLGTLLLDLLTQDEELEDFETRGFRFDISLLASRLGDAWRWAEGASETRALPAGFFGASTGAAAALVAAARIGEGVRAIVARGGRPDLAGAALPAVRSPALFVVGGKDETVLRLNELALAELRVPKNLAVVPGATHLFEEPGALDRVAALACDWFEKWLRPQ